MHGYQFDDLHLTFIFSVSWSDLHFCKLSLLLYLGSGCFVQALTVCLFVCFVLRLTWSYWKAWSQRGQPPHSFPSPREEKMLVIFCLRNERRRLPKRMMLVEMIKVSSTCLSNLSLSAILSTICFFSWKKLNQRTFTKCFTTCLSLLSSDFTSSFTSTSLFSSVLMILLFSCLFRVILFCWARDTHLFVENLQFFRFSYISRSMALILASASLRSSFSLIVSSCGNQN